MNKILRQLAFYLHNKQNTLFSFDIKKQKKYIEKFKEPIDGIERSYYQYKCQMYLKGRILGLVLNFLSFFLIFFYFISYSKKNRNIEKSNKEAIFFRDGKSENILPNSLKEMYSSIEINPKEGSMLTKGDKIFLKKIYKRYSYSWHFILKSIIKIARYSFVIEKYSPKAIIVCAEYSFTSSLLTEYCKLKNIKHINVMHGIKLYYIRDSFFYYDSCYIWDMHHKELFISLRANNEQFKIENPSALNFKISSNKKIIYDYTYYLGNETENILGNISVILNKLKSDGLKISVRPHPRYSDIKLIKKYFKDFNIECFDLTIEQSLLQTGGAISLYSTVLTQALYNSIPIVIDDISNLTNYQKLKELNYVCLKENYKKLSEVVKEENVKKNIL